MDGKPITHKNFKTVADIQEVDSEDVPMDVLAEVQNLTPFRKMGSLQLCPGHSVWKAKADLPQPSGYELIDFYEFSIDRDEKAITILIYKHPTNLDTKFYINPYWNPERGYANYLYRTPDGNNSNGNEWVEEWLELTEYYRAEITMNGTVLEVDDTEFTPALPTEAKGDGYFDSWFFLRMPNTDTDNYEYNQVQAYDYLNKTCGHTYSVTTHTFKTVGSIVGWNDADEMIIMRFPVRHLYKKSANDWSMWTEDTFDAEPTQIISAQNELRIPCGMDNRPLLLTMILKRKYFSGNSSINYDGFWFDFQTPPQVQNHSAITSFLTLTSPTTALTSVFISNDFSLAAVTHVTDTIVELERYSGGGEITCAAVGTAGFSYGTIIYQNGLNFLAVAIRSNGEIYVNGRSLITPSSFAITRADFVAAWNQSKNPAYPMLKAVNDKAGNVTIDCTSGGSEDSLYCMGTTFYGAEAGGNLTARNPFLGLRVEAVGDAFFVSPEVGTIMKPRHAFILNSVIDDKSAIMVAHGTLCAGEDTNMAIRYPSIDIKFELWFNRRLTCTAFFNKAIDAVDIQIVEGDKGTLASLVISENKYPYWRWKYDPLSNPPLDINDIPLFAYYDIYDFAKTKRGEIPFGTRNVSDITAGENAYTHSVNGNEWMVSINYKTIETNEDGQGFHYLSECNRWLDQDITMNYTKGVFLGQTNGRYFIVGCKNEIEDPVYENQDTVFANLYAAGISQYDIFLRDRALHVFMGDRDVIQSIHNYRGYLILTKQNNVYAMDVRTGDELQYRTVDTMAGRGTSNPDGMCQTPYGIVMPSSDNVWLIEPNGISPLMSPINGRLNLYRTLMSTSTYERVVQSVFYNLYNELMVFITWNAAGGVNVTTDVFVYSFTTNGWTNYQYTGVTTGGSETGILIKKVKTNVDKDVCMLNWGSASKFCMTKLDETMTTPTFYTCLEATEEIIWQFKTHQMPYAGKHEDISSVVWCQLNADAETTETKDILVKFYADQRAAITATKEVTEVVLVRNKNYNFLPPHLNECEALSVKVTNSVVTEPFLNIAINSFTIWLTKQAKKMGNL